MHVTPNRLTQVVRRTTGRWAKSFIVDRLMLEARYQLIHTDRDVIEIAYQLHFHHPTHFGQFFRKYQGVALQMFRKTRR